MYTTVVEVTKNNNINRSLICYVMFMTGCVVLVMSLTGIGLCQVVITKTSQTMSFLH